MQVILKVLLLVSAICVVMVYGCKDSQSGSKALQSSEVKTAPIVIVPYHEVFPPTKKHLRKKRYADDDDDDNKAEEIRDRVAKRFG